MRKHTLQAFRMVSLLITLALAVTSGCRQHSLSSTGEADLHADAAGESGRRGAQIIAESRKRDAAPYRKARILLSMIERDEPPKIYELEVWRKQTEEETLTLTRVVKPEGERDLASLCIQRPGQQAVSIAYAQSTDRFYESDMSKQAFGGLTIQELIGEWQAYDFRLLAEIEGEGAGMYEVEGRLQSGAKSPIHRVVALFRKDTLLPSQLRLFGSLGEEIRTFHITEYRTTDGRPLVWKTEVINHVRQSRTSIEILEVSFPEQIEDALFSREHLKRIVSRKSGERAD